MYICQPIRVINGKGRGGKIGEAINYQKEFETFTSTDFFLDNVTGDLYSYNADAQEWIPRVNVGIHHRRAAEAFDSLGKYIIKQPVYKPKPLFDNNMHYLSSTNEDFCTIKKVYLQHWALQGIEFEFKMPSKAHWDIHQFNFVNSLKTFYVLAESKLGPQIICIEPYCVGTFFPVQKRYPSTVQILKNFILTKIKEIKTMTTNQYVSIEKSSVAAKSSASNFNLGLSDTTGANITNTQGTRRISVLNKTSHNSTSHRPQTSKSGNVAHSGFAIKHSENPVMVDLNTVRSEFPFMRGVDNTPDSRPMTGNVFRSTMTKSTGRGFSATQRPMSGGRSMAQLRGTRPISGQTFNMNFGAGHESANDFANMKSYANSRENLMQQSQSENGFVKTKSEIRMMLYPEMAKEYLPQDEFWVPGNLSTASKSRPQTAMNRSRKTIRMDGSFSTKFYSRYNKDFRGTGTEENQVSIALQ